MQSAHDKWRYKQQKRFKEFKEFKEFKGFKDLKISGFQDFRI